MNKLLLRFLISFFLVSGLTAQLLDLSPGTFEDKQHYQHLGKVREGQLEERSQPPKYWNWLSKITVGDFGESEKFQKNNLSLISESLAPSLFQFLLAFIISLLVLYMIGLWTYFRTNSYARNWVLILSSSLPVVVVAVILQVLLASERGAGWLPLTGYPMEQGATWSSSLIYNVLPILTYIFSLTPYLAFLVVSLVKEELNKDYITVAKAKGLGSCSIYNKHIIKNILPILISTLPQIFYFFIISASLIEFIFNTPGIGWLTIQALQYRDSSLLMTLVVFQFLLVFVLREGVSWMNRFFFVGKMS